jgi:LmbE family N-acetylglucosaminyl deacetylase
VTSRISAGHSEELEVRKNAARHVAGQLGFESPIFHDLPDNQLDMVSLLQCTQLIEKTIAMFSPEIIYTHFPGDLNVDHRQTARAAITASRPTPASKIKRLLFFETPSSTEWNADPSVSTFSPTWFCDISAVIDKKIEALRLYGDECPAWPHARSVEAIGHLARWRGASIGRPAAEAFMPGRVLA